MFYYTPSEFTPHVIILLQNKRIRHNDNKNTISLHNNNNNNTFYIYNHLYILDYLKIKREKERPISLQMLPKG